MVASGSRLVASVCFSTCDLGKTKLPCCISVLLLYCIVLCYNVCNGFTHHLWWIDLEYELVEFAVPNCRSDAEPSCNEQVVSCHIGLGCVSVNAVSYAYWAWAHLSLFLSRPFQIMARENPNEECCSVVDILHQPIDPVHFESSDVAIENIIRLNDIGYHCDRKYPKVHCCNGIKLSVKNNSSLKSMKRLDWCINVLVLEPTHNFLQASTCSCFNTQRCKVS